MFKKHGSKRSSNPLFVIFRLFLSLSMFVLLLGGVYAAYKHFSGVDPLKMDPQALVSNLIQSKSPKQFLAVWDRVLGQSTKKDPIPFDNLTKTPEAPTSSPVFKFVLIADSHNDTSNLKKALAQAKQKYPDVKFIIGLGDYTDVGTITELTATKRELDSSGLRYFLVAGDHDLWDSRNKQEDPQTNFKEVFGPLYQSFIYENFKFLLLDNSDNYKGFGSEQSSWITSEFEKVKTEGVKGIFVLLHEPLYHPSSDHYMGKVEKDLKSQADGLIFQLKQAGVKKVFAGDIHYYSEYEEPVTKISMITVGALVTERNPQTPRFVVVTVFEDGTSKVDDIEVK